MRPRKDKCQCFLALERWSMGLPKSQNAAQTRGSASLKIAANRALYMTHEEAGDPGRGSMAKVADAVLGEAAHF